MLKTTEGEYKTECILLLINTVGIVGVSARFETLEISNPKTGFTARSSPGRIFENRRTVLRTSAPDRRPSRKRSEPERRNSVTSVFLRAGTRTVAVRATRSGTASERKPSLYWDRRRRRRPAGGAETDRTASPTRVPPSPPHGGPGRFAIAGRPGIYAADRVPIGHRPLQQPSTSIRRRTHATGDKTFATTCQPK